jgi:hypothetical protein
MNHDGSTLSQQCMCYGHALFIATAQQINQLQADVQHSNML